MNAKQKLHQVHLSEWAARFQDQKASGLPVRQWCDKNHFTIHQYNYWKHLLKEEVVGQMLPDIVPVSLSDVPSSEAPLMSGSVPAVDTRPDRTIRPNRTTQNIRLCVDGVSLELEPAIPEDFLRSLIRAVHYA